MSSSANESKPAAKGIRKTAAKPQRKSRVARYGEGFEKHLKDVSAEVREKAMNLVKDAVKLVTDEKAKLAEKKKLDAAEKKQEQVKLNRMKRSLEKYSDEDIEAYLKSKKKK